MLARMVASPGVEDDRDGEAGPPRPFPIGCAERDAVRRSRPLAMGPEPEDRPVAGHGAISTLSAPRGRGRPPGRSDEGRVHRRIRQHSLRTRYQAAHLRVEKRGSLADPPGEPFRPEQFLHYGEGRPGEPGGPSHVRADDLEVSRDQRMGVTVERLANCREQDLAGFGHLAAEDDARRD